MLSTWWRRRRPTLAQPGEKQRRLVFVLGGGGSRGACSVGVLKALLEAGIKPDGLVGCSSGAFNAVALAAKQRAAGPHAKDKASERQAAKRALAKAKLRSDEEE